MENTLTCNQEIVKCYFDDCPGREKYRSMKFHNNRDIPTFDFPLGEFMHAECYIHHQVRKFMNLEFQKLQENIGKQNDPLTQIPNFVSREIYKRQDECIREILER